MVKNKLWMAHTTDQNTINFPVLLLVYLNQSAYTKRRRNNDMKSSNEYMIENP